MLFKISYKLSLDELEDLQKCVKQLHKSLEVSGLSALPWDQDFMQDSQAIVKKARDDTEYNRSNLLRIQSNCRTLVQAMMKK